MNADGSPRETRTIHRQVIRVIRQDLIHATKVCTKRGITQPSDRVRETVAPQVVDADQEPTDPPDVVMN